jgi:hypothetical protein
MLEISEVKINTTTCYITTFNLYLKFRVIAIDMSSKACQRWPVNVCGMCPLAKSKSLIIQCSTKSAMLAMGEEGSEL